MLFYTKKIKSIKTLSGLALLAFLYLVFPFVALATTLADKIQNNRVIIGPTVNPPVEYGGKLYFLSTTGVLFESSHDLSTVTHIFQTALPTFCALTLQNGVLYFGEGLHDHDKSAFYAFDLKTKKLLFKIEVNGHIQRVPLIQEGIAYLGLGPSGIAAFDLKGQKFLWQTKSIKGGILHVDSTPVPHGNLLCAASIYNYKGIFCLNKKNGAEAYDLKMALSPKSEISRQGDLLYGYATEATMNDLNWKTPSKFFIVDLKEKKIKKEIELRGYNFFAPLTLPGRKVFSTLSTGDLIIIALDTGLITYVGEFPEPFVSGAFKMDGALCAIGVMGQLLCYKESKSGFALTVEKRYYESPIGQIQAMSNGKFYIPSRLGHFHP